MATFLVGNTSQSGTFTCNGDTGYLTPTGYTAAASGTATHAVVYLGSGVSSDTGRLAVYNSSNDLLGTSSEFPTSPSGWRSAAISGVTITSGQTYYLVFSSDGSLNVGKGGAGDVNTFSLTYPTFPSTLPSNSYVTFPGLSAYLEEEASSASTLSSPTSASVTQTGATIGATTDDNTGTLYGVVTTSASAPSATQIKAGQDHTGSAAAGSGSNASLSVGANTIAITGLTAATSYYYYLVQDNGADSNVVNGTFTTAVAAPTLTSPTAVSIGTTTVTPRVTTDTGNGTCYYVITPQAESEPSNTQVEAGTNAADGAPVASGSQVVSSAGVITFSEVTGLTAGTAYRISYAHSGTPS